MQPSAAEEVGEVIPAVACQHLRGGCVAENAWLGLLKDAVARQCTQDAVQTVGVDAPLARASASWLRGPAASACATRRSAASPSARVTSPPRSASQIIPSAFMRRQREFSVRSRLGGRRQASVRVGIGPCLARRRFVDRRTYCLRRGPHTEAGGSSQLRLASCGRSIAIAFAHSSACAVASSCVHAAPAASA